MDSRLTCQECGNLCLIPPSTGRDYACPRCGRLLPRTGAIPASHTWTPGRWGVGVRLRYLLFLAALFGLVVMGVPGVVFGPRVASSGLDSAPRRVPRLQLTAIEQRNYAFRQRQLEEDLRRDGTDFDLLRRLGQLHLRLAACAVDGRESHLRRARFYLRRAADVTMTSREAMLVRGLLDAANSPNPMLDLIGMPGDMGPPPRADEEVIRMRLGWLEEQVGLYPNSSRLLARLGDSYTALYQALRQHGEHPLSQWPTASSVNDPSEACRLAEHEYTRAIECATNQEARCRALSGSPQLYRVTGQATHAADVLRQLLELQPNNWFAALEMARLSRQLGRSELADRYEAQASRWRTPGWI